MDKQPDRYVSHNRQAKLRNETYDISKWRSV